VTGLPTEQARTEPRADGGGDQHTEQVPNGEKRCRQLGAMQGIYERAEGSGREPARGTRPTQPRRGKAPHDPEKRYQQRGRGEAATKVTTARTHIAMTATGIPMGARPSRNRGRTALAAVTNLSSPTN
jgi:hypothetical protein